MRILIEPSGYTMNNHGDSAMLFMALERLRFCYPDAILHIVNAEPDELQTRDSRVSTIAPADRNSFFQNIIPGRLLRLLSTKLADTLVKLERRLLFELTTLRLLLARLRRQLVRTAIGSNVEHGNPKSFYEQLQASDVMILTGGGALNDEFWNHALTLLDEMELAVRSGKKVYLFGQGIGPIERADLRARAQQVLPTVTGICLREGLQSLPLLKSLGVPAERIQVTGDDAIEFALPHTPARLGGDIGINFRLAFYSGIDTAQAENLGAGIRSAAETLNAPLTPVPISRYKDADDLQDVHRFILGQELPESARQRETVEDVIRAAGRCRVVVTGSYHAAVFALSQGISAVCLARSQYYVGKFLGLQDQFRDGCEVVLLDRIAPEALAEHIRNVILHTWDNAERTRPFLLQAARSQMHLSRTAYLKIAGEMNGGQCRVADRAMSAVQY